MSTANEMNQNGLNLRMIIGDNNVTVCFSYPKGSCSHQHLLLFEKKERKEIEFKIKRQASGHL